LNREQELIKVTVSIGGEEIKKMKRLFTEGYFGIILE
jgi:hypothetical protein